MSTFVELTPSEYSDTAFAAFDPAAGEFTIGNARALMWLSQLAYETGRPATIAEVGPKWGFAGITPFVRRKDGLTASFDTCGLIAERGNAIILAFAGTDPGAWETLATDFNIRPRADTDTHIGFQTALDAVQPEIRQAMDRSRQANKPLFITGHSLGAALAGLAARFCDINGSRPKAVYGYGMPRAGGARFQADYNGTLGQVTFRLVHGLDIVARVPPSGIGFRHVGRVLQCDRGAKFDPTQLSATVSDNPEFAAGLADTLVSGAEGLLAGRLLPPPGPGTFGPFFRFLPPPIRDHLQDCYYNALTA
jgi:triacylglycerol lipase